MKGPFVIIYKDHFDVRHKKVIFAHTAEEAIKLFERIHEYVVEIIDVFLDYDIMLNCSSFYHV